MDATRVIRQACVKYLQHADEHKLPNYAVLAHTNVPKILETDPCFLEEVCAYRQYRWLREIIRTTAVTARYLN